MSTGREENTGNLHLRPRIRGEFLGKRGKRKRLISKEKSCREKGEVFI